MRDKLLNFTLEQIRCLTSPLRTELLYTFLVDGPLTVVELAAIVARPPKSLYYQIRLLEQAGLIKKVGAQRAGKREERIFDAVADEMLVQPPPLDWEYRQAFADNVRSVMANAAAQFEQLLLQAPDDMKDLEPLVARRITFRMATDKRRVFAGKLREALEYARENEDKESGRRFALAILLAPTPERGVTRNTL